MRIGHIAFVLASSAGVLYAQRTPGTNLQVTVTVATLVRAGDTVTIGYRLANAASSAERVGDFFVETPSAALTVSRPTPLTHWVAMSRYGDRPMASWGILDPQILTPGTTGPTLSFTAIGIPGIVDAHVMGDYPPPELIEDSLRVESDPLVTNAIHIRVVGVDVLDKSLGAAAFIARLGTLLAESCTLGWVSNAGICQSLRVKLDAALRAVQRGQGGVATNELKALLNELSAQRGKHLNDNAYHLLRTNAEYILTRF